MKITANIIFSETGIESLAVNGISTGWLSAWLHSAGAGRVKFHLMHSHHWKHTTANWQIFIGTDDELAGISRYHSIHPDTCGHATRLMLENPVRSGWFYTLENQSVSVVLLPVGEIAYQRHRWLYALNGHVDLLPLYIWTGNSGGMILESGLYGSCIPDDQPVSSMLLNMQGQLPEEQIHALLRHHKIGIRFAESCTAGGFSERLGRLPGISDVLDRAWVTYSNKAKHDMLHVPQSLLDTYGAVSREVVESMADGGYDASHACVAVSGIAGPDGGLPDKPVGTVWIAVALPDGNIYSVCYRGYGSRAEIRRQTIHRGLGLLIKCLQD